MQTVTKILRNLRAVARLHPLSQAVRDWMHSDGLPVPPQELRYLVSGDPSYTKSSFFEMGRLCAQRIVEALKKTGVEIDGFDAILDFGCGCGRAHPAFPDSGKSQAIRYRVQPEAY